MVTTVLNVSGMACDGCASKVKNALGNIEGVSSVDVVLEGGRVEVAYTESAEANLSKFQEVIEDIGFDIEA